MSDYVDPLRPHGRSLDPSKFDGPIGDEGFPSLRRSTQHATKDAAPLADAVPSATPTQVDQKALAAIRGDSALQEARRAYPELRKASRLGHEVAERVRALHDVSGEPSEIDRIAKQLQEKQRSMGAPGTLEPELFAPTPARHPDTPPNAVDGTNDRLERIERRFEQMLDVAANGAEVATGLQKRAADFLARFEAAALDNDRSAARATWLAAVAVAIAAAIPIVQILYTEFWRVPRDSATTEAIIAGMRAEISALRQAQVEATDRLAAALERADPQAAEALRRSTQPVDAPPPALTEEPPLGE